MTAHLSATAVSQRLTTRWLGKNCQVLPEVDSTNDLLKEMVQQGDDNSPPAGFVLLVEYQRQGRGRLARRWEAPAGSSLLLSMLFRPHWPAAQATWLTMLVSVAASEAIAVHTALAAEEVRLKWPNDVMVRQDHSWHKVSGILQEGSFATDGRLQWAVVGIGINVNISVDELPSGITPPTSLLVATGQPVPRLPLLCTFLERVEALYEEAENGRSPQPAWQKKLMTIGQHVDVTNTQTSDTFSGMAEATDEAGHLLVRDAMGRLHTVSAADVTLRRK